jgi:hypothetical protein
MRVQLVQLTTFQINGTAYAQYLSYMRFNLVNNISIHFEVMASEGLKEMGGVCVELRCLVRKSPFGNLAFAYPANGWSLLQSRNG